MAKRKFRIIFSNRYAAKSHPPQFAAAASKALIFDRNDRAGVALEGTKSRWKRSPPRRAAARNASASFGAVYVAWGDGARSSEQAGD